ncbi:ProQ/FinO family protein [Cupriavidus necator]|uniref:ProQ/FinO family protein n=1 Tax=Cupriavidus necator TaxID=106590 RepID=UPI0005B49C34|nr:ProQ/FinO family protein [Cupriavidus necator]
MGFEQLAALRVQLAEQAKAEKAAKAPKRARPPRARDAAPANPAKPAKSVDPVVHAIARLQRRFPLAFPKNPAPKVPLKIGIFEDLLPYAQDLSLSEAELREAIKTWCRGARYWACLIEGASRMDLAGQEAGQVRPEDAKRAQQLQARRWPGAPSKSAKASHPVDAAR